jgi:hypothetical protein
MQLIERRKKMRRVFARGNRFVRWAEEAEPAFQRCDELWFVFES